MAEQEFEFPFEPYEIQKGFMRAISDALEFGKVGIFESPTGTGKSLSLICSSLTWLANFEAKRRRELEKTVLVSDSENSTTNNSSSQDDFDWLNSFDTCLEKKREAEMKRTELEKLQQVDEKLKKLKEKVTRTGPKLAGKRMAREEIGSLDDFESASNDEDLDSDIAPVDYNSDEESLKKLNSFEEKAGTDESGVTKIFYCSRTHSQLAQFLQEIRKTKFAKSVRVVTLGSRQTFCINPEVKTLKSVNAMNDRCLEMQKNKNSANKAMRRAEGLKGRRVTKAKCPFYRSDPMHDLADDLLLEIRDIENTVMLAKKQEACPYYASRYAVPLAEVVLSPYQTLFHESTRKSCGIDLSGNIVVVDEAHNLQDALASLYSVEISKNQLTLAHSQLSQYIDRFRDRLKAKNLFYVRQLRQVILALIGCLRKNPSDSHTAVFRVIDFLFDVKISDVNFYKLLNYMDKSEIAKKLSGFAARYSLEMELSTNKSADSDSGVQKFLKQQQTPQTPLQAVAMENGNRSRPGSSSMFQVRSFLETFTFAADDGRILNKGNTSLRFLLLNPLAHFRSVVSSAYAVILAGGTMHPEGELKEELMDTCQVPVGRMTSFSCGHVIPSHQLLPVAVGVGPSGKMRLNFSFDTRNRAETLTELGRIFMNLVRVVPGGLVVFLPSYDYETRVIEQLKQDGTWGKLEEKKRIFREPKAAKEVDPLLEDYAKSVRGPKKGAMLFAVVGGKMSEGINFADDLGRCVMMVGLPYPNKNSPELKEKLHYLDTKRKSGTSNQIAPSQKHYENLCWKAINQSVGRAIRHRNDYAAILLMDERFCAEKTKKRLPGWIGENLEICDKSFGTLIGRLKRFFDVRKE